MHLAPALLLRPERPRFRRYTPVRSDGVKGDPVQVYIPPPTPLVSSGILNLAQASSPEALICDPRVMNRVQTHLNEGNAGFHLNILDSSGNLLPRKLAVTPMQMTFLSPPVGGQPGVCAQLKTSLIIHLTLKTGTQLSYPLSQQTDISLVPGDLQVTSCTHSSQAQCSILFPQQPNTDDYCTTCRDRCSPSNPALYYPCATPTSVYSILITTVSTVAGCEFVERKSLEA